MCGIVAFLGKDQAYFYLYNGLKQLQNRGYDSAGIALFHNDKLVIHKHASTETQNALSKLEPYLENYSSSYCGIGHTRWATHGEKNDTNSHPHQSADKLFTLVHNGIIENYQELKNFLLNKGYTFSSETDSEVIVQLLSYYFTQTRDVNESLKKTTQSLNGTWGLAVLYTKQPNRLYCTRKGSPLLVGIEKNKLMVTSEQSGFCNSFSQYIVLNNHDICVIQYKENENKIFMETTDTYSTKDVLRNKDPLDPAPYKYWMLREIHEQKDSSFRAIGLGGRILSPHSVKLGGLEHKTNELLELNNLILLGCGTSYHAGMIGIQCFKEMGDFNCVQLVDGAEFTVYDIPKTGKTGLVLMSQSGETKDLHRCIDIAKAHGLFMIGIVNVVDSLIAREVDCGCYLNAGREVSVASTKSFTSQVILLNLLCIWFAQMKNTNKTKRIQMIKDLSSLSKDIETTIAMNESKIQDLVNMFKGKHHCFLLGKGKGESVAREGALKIKEVSYIHAEGYSTSSLKHGPFALLEKDFPVLLCSFTNHFYEKDMNAYEEIKSRNAKIILISNKRKDDHNENEFLEVPSNTTFQEIYAIIVIQLLAYYLALDMNYNPDFPRNLAKVVTVE